MGRKEERHSDENEKRHSRDRKRERGRRISCERGRHSEEMVRETFQKERDGGEDLPDKERDILRRREERHFLKREREGEHS